MSRDGAGMEEPMESGTLVSRRPGFGEEGSFGTREAFCQLTAPSRDSAIIAKVWNKWYHLAA